MERAIKFIAQEIVYYFILFDFTSVYHQYKFILDIRYIIWSTTYLYLLCPNPVTRQQYRPHTHNILKSRTHR